MDEVSDSLSVFPDTRNLTPDTLSFGVWDLGFVLRTPTLRAGSRFRNADWVFEKRVLGYNLPQATYFLRLSSKGLSSTRTLVWSAEGNSC